MVRKAFWLIPSLALIAACSPQKEEQPKVEAKPVLTLHEMMTQKIDVDADAIWEIGNAAINDQASIDPAKMTAKNWQDLQAAAQRMSGDAHTLGALDPLVVTRPGVKVSDEGTPGAPTPAEIEGHLNRDRELYRSLAESLSQHAATLAAAAQAKDAAKAGQVINELDGVCEACHLEFWYPEQKAMVEAIMAKANGKAQ